MAKLSFDRLLGSFSAAVVFATIVFALGNPAYAATYNVKFYGAKGDGTTDDSKAIAKAIAAASQSSGNIVQFPFGTYVIGSDNPSIDVSVSMTLQGNSGGGTRLNMTDKQSHININGDGVTINQFAIANVGSNKNSAIVYENVNGGTVTNCFFTGWVNGIRLKRVIGITINQNSFYMPTNETGVLIQRSALNTTIKNNKFVAITKYYGYGVYLPTDTPSGEFAGNVTLTNNRFDDLGYAVYKQGFIQQSQGIVASSNTFNSCYYAYNCSNLESLQVNGDKVNNTVYGICPGNCSTVSIQNCAIDSPSGAGISANISQNASSGKLQILNNTVTNLTTSYAIGIGLQSAGTVANNTITGSKSGNAQAGIYVNGGGGSAKLTGNTISGAYYGIQTDGANNVFIKNNTISKTQLCGIYTYKDSDDTIQNNTLKNCGLASGTYAVIYVYSPSNAVVTDNTYTAQSTPNLTYFVYVDGGTVVVKNNKTNTMLPSYP